ncbi:MAG: transposase [Lachnospiraceae bacterium]|nr:transposase [Lachnospiraceae bacterium]
MSSDKVSPEGTPYEKNASRSIVKVCRTIHQHNQEPLSDVDMQKLLAVAEDYRTVKNYVYARFGGISGLPKLYPGYTIQNEMTKSGLREKLGMPSVYFYLAIFEALGDLKNQWIQVKDRVLKAVGQNKNFTSEDAHYLRYVLKVNNCFEAILNYTPIELTKGYESQYQELASLVNCHKLDNYLRRQVRKYQRKLRAEQAEGFSIAERAYRYGDHGIYLSTKESRKRVFVPLTDNNQYTRQLYIKLHREKNGLEILVPIDVRVRRHEDYENQVGISFGIFTMLTTDKGCTYGNLLGEYVIRQTEWIQKENRSYQKNRQDNPGRKRYTEQKRKMDERLHTYINEELNRFLREEKPKVIYLPKLPTSNQGGKSREYNRTASMWQRGYIRRRLLQKCVQQSVEVVEVFGKDISRGCSQCGEMGTGKDGVFLCSACGLKLDRKVNAARNVKSRGEALK